LLSRCYLAGLGLRAPWSGLPRPVKQVRPAGGADRTVCTTEEGVVRYDFDIAPMSIRLLIKAT